MMTNIDLPKVLSFESEDHVLDFIEAATEIIPKIKFQHIGGEGYNCVLYTRKDKHYRAIMEAALAPVTIIETPVGITNYSPGNRSTAGTSQTLATGEVLTMTFAEGPSGYYAMPTDPLPNAK